MAFTLTSITPTTIPEDGGHLVTLVGTFEMSHSYKIYIGKTGTSADAPCYSGKAGQGNVIRPYTATTLKAYSPILPLGGPYEVLVVDAGTAEQHSLSKVITATYRDLKSGTYSLRKMLPPFYKTGPRAVPEVPAGVGDYVPPFSDPEAAWWTFGGTPDALKLLGTDSKATIFDPQSNSDDFTIMGVFNPTNVVGNKGLFSKWISADFKRCYMVQQFGDDLEIFITSNGGVGTISTISVPNILVGGVDAFFCVRYKYITAGTSLLAMRVDGTENDISNAQGPIRSDTGAPIQIACSDGNYFPGKVYWLAYWNRRLTDSEVAAVRAKTIYPQELTPNSYEDFHDAVASENDSEMPIADPIPFAVEGTPTHSGSSASSVVEENTRTLGFVGLIEGITQVAGEASAEFGGLRMTRTTAVISATDTNFLVETTQDWPSTGKVGLDGIVYYYTGKTATTFTGITHIAAGSSVAGARIQHRIDSTIVDLSGQYSALDLLRRGFLVNYAEGNDLNALARNLGVDRYPIFRDDDQFRATVKALAYSPRGTVQSLELALDSLLGAGNYEIYEDLIAHPCTVYIRIDPDVFTETISAGKAYLNPEEWDDLAGAQKTLVLSRTPLAVTGVQLYDLGELFDFKNAKPSAITYPYYPGATPASAFTYAGTDAEGTYVVVVSGSYTRFISNGGTVFYRMLDTQGARITEKSVVETSAVVSVDEASLATGGLLQQASIIIHDGAFLVNAGVDAVGANTYSIGLYSTPGGGFLGSTKTLTEDTFYEILLRKVGDEYVELYVDGELVDRQLYSAFAAATANHRIEFGIQGAAGVGWELQYKQLGLKIETATDFWNARGATGSVAAVNPTRFDDGAALMVAADVGKYLTIRNSGIWNPAGGRNNGHYLVDSYVGPGVVELTGPVKPGVTVELGNPKRVTLDDPEGFTYPDDLGKKIVISGSSLGNNGTYTIEKLWVFQSPVTYKDLALYKTGNQITVKTNICTVLEVDPFVSEGDLNYQLKPVFANEGTLDWELSDAGSFSGATLTLRQALWANGLIMQMRYSDVLTGQLLKNNQIDNVVIATGPPVLYEYYPFYVSDILALVRAYIDALTAAGVIPEFMTI